jgi:hypothetical protein
MLAEKRTLPFRLEHVAACGIHLALASIPLLLVATL